MVRRCGGVDIIASGVATLLVRLMCLLTPAFVSCTATPTPEYTCCCKCSMIMPADFHTKQLLRSCANGPGV